MKKYILFLFIFYIIIPLYAQNQLNTLILNDYALSQGTIEYEIYYPKDDGTMIFGNKAKLIYNGDYYYEEQYSSDNKLIVRIYNTPEIKCKILFSELYIEFPDYKNENELFLTKPINRGSIIYGRGLSKFKNIQMIYELNQVKVRGDILADLDVNNNCLAKKITVFDKNKPFKEIINEDLKQINNKHYIYTKSSLYKYKANKELISQTLITFADFQKPNKEDYVFDLNKILDSVIVIYDTRINNKSDDILLKEKYTKEEFALMGNDFNILLQETQKRHSK